MEIVKDIFCREFTFNLGKSCRSVYLVLIKGKKNCLVDTGTAANYQDVIEFCRENGLGIEELDMVINTHCHPDHIGANLLLKKANPGLMFYAHRLAGPYIENIDLQHEERPVPGFYGLISGPVRVDCLLEDGDAIEIGEEIKVIHTPGHSADSISLFLPGRDLLIIGDAVPGRDDIPIYEDVRLLREGFKRLEETGAEHVVSSFEGHQTGIGSLVESGREVLERIDRLVEDYLAANGKEHADHPGDLDVTAVSRYVLDRLGKDIPPIGIFITSIRSHVVNLL